MKKLLTILSFVLLLSIPAVNTAGIESDTDSQYYNGCLQNGKAIVLTVKEVYEQTSKEEFKTYLMNVATALKEKYHFSDDFVKASISLAIATVDDNVSLEEFEVYFYKYVDQCIIVNEETSKGLSI